MNYQQIQLEYNKIYSYFRTTCESFDLLEWDGKILEVWQNDMMVEVYPFKNLNFILGSKNNYESN